MITIKKKKPFQIGEKQNLAATLFWEGHTVQEVADRVGVHRTTIWRWYQHKEMIAHQEKVNRRGLAEWWKKTRKEWREQEKEYQRRLALLSQEGQREVFLQWARRENLPPQAVAEALNEIKNDAT